MRYCSLRLLVLVSIGIAGVFSAPAAQAQRASKGDFARNSIFVEGGGNGFIYSLNYDHKLFDHLSARIGGMYFSDEGTEGSVQMFLLPVMANYLAGNGSSRLELGAGLLIGDIDVDSRRDDLDDVDIRGAGFTTTIGYRLQPRSGGFLFRIGFTPIIGKDGITPWGGLSLGATF